MCDRFLGSSFNFAHGDMKGPGVPPNTIDGFSARESDSGLKRVRNGCCCSLLGAPMFMTCSAPSAPKQTGVELFKKWQ